MGHHPFSLRSIQVPPVPAKGVPELAGPVLESLQTLGLAVVGSGRSQPQHGEFANPHASRRGSSSNPVDAGNVPNNLRSLLRCTLWHAVSCGGRGPRQPSPDGQECVTPGISSSPITRSAVGRDVTPWQKMPRPLRIKPSAVKIPNRDYQNDAKKLVYATGDVATAELPAWPELALVEGGPKC